MTTFVLVVCCLVYLGMILGALPYLSLDRAGISLLGTITLLAPAGLALWSGRFDMRVAGVREGLKVTDIQRQ